MGVSLQQSPPLQSRQSPGQWLQPSAEASSCCCFLNFILFYFNYNFLLISTLLGNVLAGKCEEAGDPFEEKHMTLARAGHPQP